MELRTIGLRFQLEPHSGPEAVDPNAAHRQASSSTCPVLTLRDLRVDLMRGLALLCIYTDHVNGNVFSLFTPIRFGLSDMAEVFVFLSGYVCGLVYGRLLPDAGFWACQRKAIVRCAQLYAAHIATLFVMIGLLWAANWARPSLYVAAGFGEFSRFLENPQRVSWDVLLLRATPGNFEILPLYACVVALLPAMLLIAKRSRWFMLAISLLVYSLVQCFPQAVALPDPWHAAWLFNPFAWQVLFILGAFVRAGSRPFHLNSKFKLTCRIVAFLVVEAVFLLKVFNPAVNIPWSGKGNLEPLRLAYFLFLLMLLWNLAPSSLVLARQRWLYPVTACGQNSLLIYCTGALLSTLGSLLIAAYGSKIAWHIAVNFGGWALCAAIAMIAGTLKTRSGRMSVPLADHAHGGETDGADKADRGEAQTPTIG